MAEDHPPLLEHVHINNLASGLVHIETSTLNDGKEMRIDVRPYKSRRDSMQAVSAEMIEGDANWKEKLAEHGVSRARAAQPVPAKPNHHGGWEQPLSKIFREVTAELVNDYENSKRENIGLRDTIKVQGDILTGNRQAINSLEDAVRLRMKDNESLLKQIEKLKEDFIKLEMEFDKKSALVEDLEAQVTHLNELNDSLRDGG